MGKNVVELTDATFDETIQSDMPVLVDFWAPWCGPCKMLGPVVEELAGEYDGKATICKIDTDEHRDSAIKYGINAIPTVICLRADKLRKNGSVLPVKRTWRPRLMSCCKGN